MRTSGLKREKLRPGLKERPTANAKAVCSWHVLEARSFVSWSKVSKRDRRLGCGTDGVTGSRSHVGPSTSFNIYTA